VKNAIRKIIRRKLVKLSTIINDSFGERLKLIQIKNSNKYFGDIYYYDSVLLTNKRIKVHYNKIEFDLELKKTKEETVKIKGIKKIYDVYETKCRGIKIELLKYSNKNVNCYATA
jgi:hypothetical protein